MKLHLCCGKRDFGPGWIHIDQERFKHVKFYDVTQLQFKDDSIEEIYCSHGIAYWDQFEIVNVLKEWYRVLKVGGIIRIATPDLDSIIRWYMKSGEILTGPLYGRMTGGNEQDGFYQFYHKTIYTFTTLKNLLNKIGFHDVKRYDWKTTEHAHIDDHSQAYMPHLEKETGMLISLNVEAIK